MNGFIHILTNDATLIAMLADGANSIFTDVATQGESTPYIIIDSQEKSPINTFSGSAPQDNVMSTVFCISDRKNSSGGVFGTVAIAERCRTLLEGVIGTYDSDVIKDSMLEGESNYTERYGDKELSVKEQSYNVTIDR